MIKLIVSDLDGTLLDDEKNLPADMFEVLDLLKERGIRFAPASGRTYSAFEYMFPEEYKRQMCFICDNGACTFADGKALNIVPIEKPVFLELLNECERIGGLTPVVCAESGVFHRKCDEKFFEEVGLYYKNHKVVDDLADIEGIIYKLAICDENDFALTHGKAALDAVFAGRLNVLVSGAKWMDVMAGGVSKGAALRSLQERFGITPEETMAFGDYFNDIEMLMAAEWSFCMQNGHEDVKRLCGHIAPDNNHGGVTRCIKRYALNMEK